EAQTNEGSGRCVGKPEVIAKKRCPKSSATSIGLRLRILATIAERISHSHPALTVAGATRIQHHCGTCGDRDATGFFCPALPLPSSVGKPFSDAHFSGHCFRLIPASCSFASSAFPVPPLPHWVPSHKAAALFGSRSHSLLGAPRKWGKKKEKIQSWLTYMLSGIGRGYSSSADVRFIRA